MSAEINSKKSKGGRPLKAVKMDQQLAVMCTVNERKIIETKASAANVSVSEFLRTIALLGQVDRRVKTFPKEVLLFTATLNHLAANINQIAKKKNQNDELSDTERAGLKSLIEQIKTLVSDIKNFLL